MILKSVAFFIENIGNLVVSINGTTYNESITTLVNNSKGVFWIQAGDDGIADLCTQIDSSIQTISGTFNNGQSNYTIVSNNFVGGRPPHRPH